jgi:hypothetical protein
MISSPYLESQDIDPVTLIVIRPFYRRFLAALVV